MSDDGVNNVKCRLLKILSEMNGIELDNIEHWISSQSYKKELQQMKNLNKSERRLTKIGDSIKNMVPLEAIMPTENIIMPTIGDQADCTKVNTCHVDEFLYDEENLEELIKDGQVQKYYSVDCNSRNIKELNIISHSMSKNTLQYIFKVLLPGDLDGKQVLDIGSRIGAVVFSAYYLTNASTIIGVEINKECCEVQEKIIREFSMDNSRIKIINSDIMDQKDIITNSNVFIINVLDFFVDIEKHKEIWYFFKQHMRKGNYIVTNKSMPEILDTLDICEEFFDWLTVCKPSQMENEIFFDIENLYYSELFLYLIN